jgi:transposase
MLRRWVLDTGRPIAQVARELGVYESSLGRWVAQQRADRGETDDLTSDERARLRELEREVADLRMERELLKRSVPSGSRKRRHRDAVPLCRCPGGRRISGPPRVRGDASNRPSRNPQVGRFEAAREGGCALCLARWPCSSSVAITPPNRVAACSENAVRWVVMWRSVGGQAACKALIRGFDSRLGLSSDQRECGRRRVTCG